MQLAHLGNSEKRSLFVLETVAVKWIPLGGRIEQGGGLRGYPDLVRPF